MYRLNRVIILGLVVPIFLGLLPSVVFGQEPRLIEIFATKNNEYRCPGQKGDPVINLKAGEVVKLRFHAVKGPEWEKDGTVHDFTVKEFKDQGWSVRLKEGTKDVTLVVPDKPGEYLALCANVKCGKGHDDMKAKLVIKP